MGVNDPVEAARTAFITSRAYTDVIVTAIKDKGDFSVYDHLQQMTQAKKEMNHEIKGFQEDSLTSILTSQSEGKKRAIQRVVKGKTSTWLTVLPHALDCRKGGLIIQRHNEVRDALGDLASIAFREMLILLRRYLIFVSWTLMPSLILAALLILFSYQLRMRRNTWMLLRLDMHLSPLLSPQLMVSLLMKLLATKIALKWEKPLSEVTGWVRATLAFAILRATNLCIRGSRVKWRSAVHMDDGAGLPTNGGVQFTWKMVLDYPQMEECSSHG
eukprot:Em0005g1528a